MSATMPQLFVNEETLKQRFLPGMAVLTNTVHGRWLMGGTNPKAPLSSAGRGCPAGLGHGKQLYKAPRGS